MKDSDRYYLTALHTAAFHGKVDICQWLVTVAGVNVSAKDRIGFTALHRAAHNGHRKVCEYLLFQAHSPCDFFDTDDDGLTALGVARKFGQEILAKWLASVEKDLWRRCGSELQFPLRKCKEGKVEEDAFTIYQRKWHCLACFTICFMLFASRCAPI